MNVFDSPGSSREGMGMSGGAAGDCPAGTVLIVKSNLEPYRLPFYDGLQRRLARERMRLRVAVPVNRCFGREASWLVPVPGGDVRIAGRILSWQRILEYARGAQLVIAQQCARELTNYWLLALRRLHGYRLALWGHGIDFQQGWTAPVTELIKRKIFATVDYWFAYTPGVAEILRSRGYPAERICTVFKSVDTAVEFRRHQGIAVQQKHALRDSLGIRSGARVVSYCGSLYKAKRLDFLVQACRRIRCSGVDVHLLLIGDGKERERLDGMSRDETWIHLAGSAYGESKALYLASSECMAIPGIVGLAVVDAFAHECPLVTTCLPSHGPEIEYLVPGVNGMKSANNLEAFAAALRQVLSDEDLRARLRDGCRRAAANITMENMVERFAAGALAALRLPHYRRGPAPVPQAGNCHPCLQQTTQNPAAAMADRSRTTR